MADTGTEKLLGKQTLDYSEVEKSVSKVNELLSSLGKNINLDMTEVVKKQVKASQTTLINEVKNASEKTSQSSGGIGKGFSEADSQIKDVIKTIRTLGAEGEEIRKVTSGFDELGNSIREFVKNGELATRVITEQGDYAKRQEEEKKIWKELEAEQRAYVAAEKALWKEQEAEQRAYINSEKQLMKELEEEQARYIAQIENREKAEREALEARNNAEQVSMYREMFDLIEERQRMIEEEAAAERAARQEQIDYINRLEQAEREALEARNNAYREREYAELFDSIGAKEYLDSLDKQIDLTKQLYDAKQKAGTDPSSSDDIQIIEDKLRAEQEITQELLSQNPALKNNREINEKTKRLAAEKASGEKKVTEEIKRQEDISKRQGSIQDQITRTLTSMVTIYMSRAISQFWKDSIDYASKYYDLLNEIRIVSGATEAEAEAMGQTYRNMAKEMNVSSTEIAKAANEFWRQGIDESSVNERLEYTVKYAKISGQEFERAAELVTAATNSMDQDAKRVADVFSYLGDASASGADEIGIAMQKASASAQEAGISFEWLGAYIATVSEKTRQAPEAIGTAFNSLMSRLQSIKQKGFNEEDATKVNDVAKALSSLEKPIKIIDESTGEWRNMSDIFMDIALQWGTMDDKARAYVATVMAGTRQKNVFLTLMNDLSNVASETGEASRAMELYNGALESVGVSTEKYEVWMESVEAAQGRMKTAFEELYALVKPDWIKGFYDGIAVLTTGFTNATEALHGMNLVIPVVLAGIASMIASGATLGTLMSGLLTWITGPIGAAVTAFSVGVLALSSFGSVIDSTKIDIENSLSSVEKKLGDIATANDKLDVSSTHIDNLKNRYIDLSTQANLSAKEQEELDRIMDEIAALSPNLAGIVENVTDKYKYQTEVVAGQNKELREKQRLNAAEAREAARNTFSSLVETGESIRKSKASSSDKIALVDEFINARKDNGLIDITSFAENYARDYVDSMLESYQYIEGGLDQIAYEMGKATDFKVFSSTYEELISQFADWLSNEWTAVQDEAKILDSQENEWRQQIQSILAVFADMDQFQTDAYRNYGQEIVNEIIAGFDYDGDLESQLTLVSGKIMDTFGRLLTEEATMQADPVKGGFISQLESAYKEFSETGSKEALESYNKTVDQWNALGGVQFEKLDNSLIKVLEETGKAAGKAAGEVNKATTAAERFFNEEARREYKIQSQKTGYFNDLTALRESYATGGLQSYRSEMDKFADTNPELFRSMAEEHAELGKIYNGDNNYYGEDAIKWLDILITNAGNIGAKWEEYYDTVDSVEVPEVREDSKTQDYIKAMVDAMTQGGEQYGLDAVANLFGTFDEDVQNMLAEVMPGIEELSSQTMSYTEQLKTLNEQLTGTKENSLAFFDELRNMESLNNEEMLESLTQLEEMLSSSEGIDNFRDAWNELEDGTKESIKKLFDDGEEFFEMIEDESRSSEDSLKDFQKEISKLKLKPLIEMGEIWEEVGDIIEAVDKDEAEMMQTAGKLNERITEITKAQEDLRTVMDASDKTSESYTDALENLESVCGFAINTEADLALAQSYLASQMDVAANSSAWLLNYLYGISGSTFNSSTWQSQLAALASSGDVAAQVMWGLIQNLKSIDGSSVTMDNGVFTVNNLGAAYKPKQLTGFGTTKPSGSSKSGGSSGGGSGSGSSSYHSEIKDMLDIMDQIQDIQNHYRDMIQEARSYYEEAGYLSAAIKTYEDEKRAVEDNNDVLESNIRKIEKLITAKKKQLSGLSRTSEEYANVADELDGLQQAHQDYTLELMENQTALEEFDNAIEEVKNEIRDMEIELRETIHQAIEDREELNERMLQGTIDVENEVMDVITKRYEKERDMAIEAAEAKREALEQEKAYLREQLEARKALAEEEDKQKELADLQAKLARISADPTRKKEELELRQKIADLRDEMAWDLAEKEVEAQEESIDQQIDSLDEYIEYVEGYYEDLFEHPQKLLEEVEDVMKRTDEEILKFLAENNEEFANSTAATQESMTNAWKDMLMDMRGETETHWDEVESIIAQGDEAIIAFLKENSAEYKAAGKLQAEKYVDEWEKQLSNLKKAYANMYKEISSYDYTPIVPSIPSSGSGSSGGGSSGGTTSKPSTKIYRFRFKQKDGSWSVNYGGTSVYSAFQAAQSAAISYWNKYKGQYGVGEVLRLLQNATASNPGAYLKQFKRGGLANFTGPAWLDGSKSAPERILSPYQTKLFEDMIKTLHAIKINVPSMPAGIYEGDTHAQTITFGDIIIQVDELAEDTDYKDLANHIMEEITERMTRGSAVGGIRRTR